MAQLAIAGGDPARSTPYPDRPHDDGVLMANGTVTMEVALKALDIGGATR